MWAQLGDDWVELFYDGYELERYNVMEGLGLSLTGLIVVTVLVLSTGFAAFAANVIQFGIDQLQDLPAKSSFLFIHWFLLTVYTGNGIVFILGMPLSLCSSRSKWFTTDIAIGNPYREVIRVVAFARRHKIPIRRSAFTYWEDDIPTGLDLGKSKYGGPFTTNQMENVKAFFGISYLFSQ